MTHAKASSRLVLIATLSVTLLIGVFLGWREALVVLVAVREPSAPAEAPGEAVPGLRDALRQVGTAADRSGLFLLGAIFAWFVGWNAMEAFFTIYARAILGVEVGTGTQMLTAFAAATAALPISSRSAGVSNGDGVSSMIF